MDSPLSSPFLFAHVYDIDTVLAALCGPAPQWLNTRTGQLQPTAEGAEPGFVFEVTPLPATVATVLQTHADLRFLSPEDQATLQGFLATAPVQDYPAFFDEGRPGGWLRERLKNIALDYLDAHGLVPPSLRHINRNTNVPSAVQDVRKVNIT